MSDSRGDSRVDEDEVPPPPERPAGSDGWGDQAHQAVARRPERDPEGVPGNAEFMSDHADGWVSTRPPVVERAPTDGDVRVAETDPYEHEDPLAAARRAVAEAYEQQPEVVPEPEADEAQALTPGDLQAIEDYTRMGYLPLNSALSEGSIDDVADVADRSHDLSAVLAKLPDYEGTVVRGSDPDTPLEHYDLSRYEPGEVVIEPRYLSTTASTDGLLDDFDGPIAWVIESSHGKDISGLSYLPNEAEVLFDRFSAFEVLSREFDPESGDRGTWVIYMRETRHR